MPVDDAVHLYESLRQLCLVNPLEAKRKFTVLLEGESTLLESVLEAAAEPGGARVRSMIARALQGHRAFSRFAGVLGQWHQTETDEFARMAIADALATMAPRAKKAVLPRLTNDLPDLAKTYEFLSRRLRHRVLNVLPRAGLSTDQLRDALAEGRDLGSVLTLVDDLKTTLRHLEKSIDQVADEGDFEPMEFRLIDWLRAFAARFRVGGAKVEVTIEADGDATAVVNANGYLLDIIFKNLWVNSVQAVEGPCRITTRVSVAPAELVVTVLDNGAGLVEEDAERAFRLQYSSSPDPERGRGHMEVADAMRRLGGEATVERIPAGGFRAVLRFPRR